MGCIDNNNCQWMPNAITTCLHMVLWNCIGSLAIAICLSIAATDDSILCPAAAFTLVSVRSSDITITRVPLISHSRQPALHTYYSTISFPVSKLPVQDIRSFQSTFGKAPNPLSDWWLSLASSGSSLLGGIS